MFIVFVFRVNMLRSNETLSAPESSGSLFPSFSRYLLIACLATTGCDIAEKFSPQRPGPKNTQNAAGNQAEYLEMRLQKLQQEAKEVDGSLVQEIQQIRSDLSEKMTKQEAKQEIKKQLSEEHERIEQIRHETDEVEKRLRTLQEHLGIIPQTSDPPWYENKPDTKKED